MHVKQKQNINNTLNTFFQKEEEKVCYAYIQFIMHYLQLNILQQRKS